MQSANNSSVNLKVPTFTPEKIRIWFCMLESFFTLANITGDDLKFAFVVTNVHIGKAAEMIEPILLDPPAENRYEKVKETLLQFEDDEREREVRDTLAREKQGDSTPSEFLSRLRKLAPQASVMLLRDIWLSNFPKPLVTLISKRTDNFKDLDYLSELADDIHKCVKHMKTEEEKTDSKSADLEAKVEELSENVASLKVKLHETEVMLNKCRQVAKNALFPRVHVPGFFRPIVSKIQKDHMCFYHSLFGDKARKCQGRCMKSK